MDIIIRYLLSILPFVSTSVSILLFSFKFYSKKLKTVKGFKIYRILSCIIASPFIIAIISYAFSSELFLEKDIEELLSTSILLTSGGAIAGFIAGGIWFIIFRFFEKIIAKK